MITISLKGATACIDAAEWCKEKFKHEDWDLWMENWTHYKFEFQYPHDATLFSLRWAESAIN